ncbi:hypothetical protein BFV94_2283 [Alteromonas macleodii]|nr:hypothetical protein BFV94_2283 [Alteromonas macleodii]
MQSVSLTFSNNCCIVLKGKSPNKKFMSPAVGLGHKQLGGFAIIACLFVPHI